MASAGWRTVLVLGGIGSGRSEFARSLLAGVDQVREVADAGGDLASLSRVCAGAEPAEALLVDGLDAWLPATGRGGRTAPAEPPAGLPELAAAIRAIRARTVLVSPEVGLSAHLTGAGPRSFINAVTVLNRTVAEVVDAVVLVVAGQPVWLKGAPEWPAAGPVAATTASAARVVAALDEAALLTLPHPDEHAGQAATDRLAAAGFGALSAVAGFAASTQANPIPVPWRTARVLVLRADHAGGAAAGAADPASLVAGLRDGTGALARLAASASAELSLVEIAATAPMERAAALGDEAAADRALARGWELASQAAEARMDVLIIAAIGAGAETAAAAVVAALAGAVAEPAALLGRVRAADGTLDDRAWIERCAAVRDGMHRAKSAGQTSARAVLGELGGEDIAIATGIILGAAAHRLPLLLDGPVGAAAAQAARVLAAPARRWCLVPDHGGHPTVVRVCELLGLSPPLDLGLALGEGASSLAALPLLHSALDLATLHSPRGGQSAIHHAGQR
jgi:nicotinate-nucleotide--dimethylbenzimidazole phosphoribosyltransferase